MEVFELHDFQTKRLDDFEMEIEKQSSKIFGTVCDLNCQQVAFESQRSFEKLNAFSTGTCCLNVENKIAELRYQQEAVLVVY